MGLPACAPTQVSTPQQPCKPVEPNAPGSAAVPHNPGGSLQPKPQIQQKHKEMFAKADTIVEDTRRSFNLPPVPLPRNHFERVSNVVDTHRQLVALGRADPSKASAAGTFTAQMQAAGKDFGVNFGLSQAGPRDGEHTPLNAYRFSSAPTGEDREYQAVSQQIRAEFDNGAKLDGGLRGAMRTVAAVDPAGNRAAISLQEVEQTLASKELSPFMRQALTAVRSDIQSSGQEMTVDAATTRGSRLLFAPQVPNVESLRQLDGSALMRRLDTQGPNGAAVCDNKIGRQEIVRELTSGNPSDAERWMLNKLLDGLYTSQPAQQFSSDQVAKLLTDYKKIEIDFQVNQTAEFKQA
jgi:hypothetical protein